MRPLWFIVALCLATSAVCLESKLLSPAELSKRIRMTQITSFSQTDPTIRTPDFLLTSGMDEPLFTLHGRDISGKPWRVILDDAARGAWRSDFNGGRTYYFAGYTGGAGFAPFTWILVLTFDQRRRPIPFFVLTHGGYDKDGPEDVLNLDGTGPALLQQEYWGSYMDDPGYYVTTLYKQRGPYWYRSDGPHGEHIFPTFEKWSVISRDRPPLLVDHPPQKEPVLDATNDPARGERTTVVKVGGNLRIASQPQCKSVGFDVIVADTPQGREIYLWHAEGGYRFISAHREMVVNGFRQWSHAEDCGASIAWVSSGSRTEK